MTAERVIELLELTPLGSDSGHFSCAWRDENSSAWLYLMSQGDFAALRRLPGPELWHHYAGAAVYVLLLKPDRTVDRLVLGDDLEAGQRPVVAAAAGVLMGAATVGQWSLVGTTMTQPFDMKKLELANPNKLLATYPEAASDIARFIWNTP